MKIISKKIEIKSEGENHMLDITNDVSQELQNSKFKNGNITIFVVGSTGAVTTIEFEPGLQKDFPEMLMRIAPNNMEYFHEQMWHDGNGRSHVKASLVGPSLTIPFIEGELSLGTWQQIVFLELDTRKRNRTIIIQIIGE